MHYSLTLSDGTEPENTFSGEPLSFRVGDGTVEPGLERMLYGLKAGERCRRSIAPGQAFPLPDPSNVHPLPRSDFPSDMRLAPGMLIAFTLPSGEEVPGQIQAVSEAEVTVDFNHPLAGRQLTLEVEVLEVRAAHG